MRRTFDVRSIGLAVLWLTWMPTMAVAVGHGRTHFLDEGGARRFDGDTREHSARRVPHGAGDAAGLRRSSRREKRKAACRDNRSCNASHYLSSSNRKKREPGSIELAVVVPDTVSLFRRVFRPKPVIISARIPIFRMRNSPYVIWSVRDYPTELPNGRSYACSSENSVQA